MVLTTREEYERKILSFQSKISKAQGDINFLNNEIRGLNMRHENTLDGQRWKARAIQARKSNIAIHERTITTAKNEIWDYQKQIAQEEQDAQVEAIKKAISEQVKAEQEKIKAQQLGEKQKEKLIEPNIIKNPVAQIQQEINK